MQQIFKIVKNCIDEWDPYGLLASGCPKNEFDNESKLISEKISFTTSKDEIVEIVSKVFSEQFEQQFFHESSCESVALKIYNELKSTVFVEM